MFSIVPLLLAGCSSGSTPKATSVPTPPSLDQVATVSASTDVQRIPGPTSVPVDPDKYLGTPQPGAVDPSAYLAVTTVQPDLKCPEKLDQQGNMTWEDLKSVTACAANYFIWPVDRRLDVEWHFDNLMNDPQMRSGRFEHSYEYTILGSVNACAWYGEWLEAQTAGDADRAKGALEVIVYVLPNPTKYVTGFPADLYDPSVTINFIQIAQKAQLGDPSLVQAYYDGNCAYLAHWKDGG